MNHMPVRRPRLPESDMQRRPARRLRKLVLGLPVVLLAGCASYHPLPLAQHPSVLDKLPALHVDASQLGLPMLAGHRFDPADGLDMTEVATLAVVNNPALKAARRRADVARAQLFAARLLPDPQLSLSTDHPTGNSAGLSTAYSVGLNYDLTQLVTRGATLDAARAARARVDLDVVWQEWQVVQQARTRYVQVVYEQRQLDLLHRLRQLDAARVARSQQALRRGDTTLASAGADLTALLDLDGRLYQLEKQHTQTLHALNALLGLSPQVKLELVPPGKPAMLPAATYRQALHHLAARRPDLLALQAGYHSQEADVHAAILAQFPSVSVGITRARDTGDVHTTGFGITLNLPFLNGNRGQIAIARATRARLWQTYQARLDSTYNQLDLLRAQQQLMQTRAASLDARLPALQDMVQRARHAYAAHDMTALSFLNLQTTLLNQQLAALDLARARWAARIAEDTLLAWPVTATH